MAGRDCPDLGEWEEIIPDLEPRNDDGISKGTCPRGHPIWILPDNSAACTVDCVGKAFCGVYLEDFRTGIDLESRGDCEPRDNPADAQPVHAPEPAADTSRAGNGSSESAEPPSGGKSKGLGDVGSTDLQSERPETRAASQAEAGRFAPLPLEVARDPKLSYAAKVMYARLLFFAGRDGVCNPSHKTLARETGMKVRNVANVLTELKAAGLIAWKRTRSSNRYTITGPVPDWQKSANLDRQKPADLHTASTAPDTQNSTGQICTIVPMRSALECKQKDHRKDQLKKSSSSDDDLPDWITELRPILREHSGKNQDPPKSVLKFWAETFPSLHLAKAWLSEQVPGVAKSWGLYRQPEVMPAWVSDRTEKDWQAAEERRLKEEKRAVDIEWNIEHLKACPGYTIKADEVNQTARCVFCAEKRRGSADCYWSNEIHNRQTVEPAAREALGRFLQEHPGFVDEEIGHDPVKARFLVACRELGMSFTAQALREAQISETDAQVMFTGLLLTSEGELRKLMRHLGDKRKPVIQGVQREKV